MKKLKVYLGVALFGAMSFGAFTAYDYMTMSADEKALLENVEALTYGEDGTPGVVDKRCQLKNDKNDTIGCYVGNHGGHCHKHADCPASN